MAMVKEKYGRTPAGGVRSKLIYTLGVGACDESVADGATVLEYDEEGNIISTTYLRLNKKPEGVE